MNIRLLMIALLAIVCNTNKAQVEGSPLADYWDDEVKGYVITNYEDLSPLQEINSTGSWREYEGISIYIREGPDENYIDYYNTTHEEQPWTPLTSNDDTFKDVRFYCRASLYDKYVAEGQGSGPLYAFGTNDGTSDSSPLYISSADDIQALIDLLKLLDYDQYAFSYYVNLENLSPDNPFQDLYFLQTTEEIDLGTISEGIGTSNSPFCGTYDGDAKNIKVNILSETESSYVALFAFTGCDATIKNLSITGTNRAEQPAYLGGIIGECKDNTTLSNCIINVKIDQAGPGSTYAMGGLIGLANNATITNSFNIGAKEQPIYSQAEKRQEIFDFDFDGSADFYGAGTEDDPILISSMEDFMKMENVNETWSKHWSEMGLCFALSDNIIDPNIEDNSNDYYIDTFFGVLSGESEDESSNKLTHIISGLTKSLFNEIIGNSTVSRIGFVNNRTNENGKVNIVNGISNDANLTVSECYSDGFFDLGHENSICPGITLTDCYSYNNMGVALIENYTEKTNDDKWTIESVTDRPILQYNHIEIDGSEGSVTTDALPTSVTNNQLIETDDARLQFKCNVLYNDKRIRNLRLLDVMDVDVSDDEAVNSISFSVPTGEVILENAYYRRKANNDWESMCLPFAYNLSDIQNRESFVAYTFSNNGNNDDAVFEKLEENAHIEACQPVLYLNKDKKDFIVSVHNNEGIEFCDKTVDHAEDIFCGVLRSTGLNTGASDDSFSRITNVYKIAGAKTQDGGGTLLKCTEGSWIYPFRAYLDFGDTAEAKSIRFSITDDNTTSIDAAELATKLITTDNIYSLDGRKVSAKGLKAGLYIMNGKKFVVK